MSHNLVSKIIAVFLYHFNVLSIFMSTSNQGVICAVLISTVRMVINCFS